MAGSANRRLGKHFAPLSSHAIGVTRAQSELEFISRAAEVQRAKSKVLFALICMKILGAVLKVGRGCPQPLSIAFRMQACP